MIYYPHPLHKNPIFNKGIVLKNTERICMQVASVPVYSGLRLEEIEKIVEVINEYN